MEGASSTANNFTIPVSELLKEASRIKEYRGNGDYDLTSFIREVEIFLPLFENTPMKEYVFQRCVINKLQGEALNVVRGLGAHSTWDLIKKELIKNFGIRDTYHQLYYRAINAKNNNNVSHYYNYLKNILDNLNTKFEQDDNKPTEFCPAVNESMILKTFLNNIPAHLASIIYSRSIGTLREAYYTLEETGLTKPTRKFDNVGKTNLTQNLGQSNRSNNTHSSENRQDQPKTTASGVNRQTASGQSKQNYSNQKSTQSRRYEPMEVDHLQEEKELEEQEIHFLSDMNKEIFR